MSPILDDLADAFRARSSATLRLRVMARSCATMVAGGLALSLVSVAPAGAAAIGGGSGDPTPPPPPAVTCHDVYFVSARGSGEPYDGPTDLTRSRETEAVYTGMTAAFEAQDAVPDVEVHQLSYPAPSTEVLFSGLDSGSLKARADRLLKHNLPSYLAQEREGETELSGYLDQILQDCESSGKTPAVVMAGYSQGAMVVHNVLGQIHADRAADKIDLIRGSVLIADPERMPSSAVVNFGSAPVDPGSDGACPALDGLPGKLSCLPSGPTREVPDRFLRSTVQVCDQGDIVCDTGSLLALNTREGFETSVRTGKFIHVNCHDYCGATVKRAGRGIGRRLVRRGIGVTALSITSTGLTAATVGTPYGEALAAEGGRPPYRWTVVAGALPPGLELSSEGILSGTPTTPASGALTFQVSDARSHVATASLVLTVEGIPDGLAIFRDTGPAGFVSYVTGIRCPAPSGGDTMWVVTGGAGGSPSDVAETVYRGGADVAWVSTAHNVSPGSYDAHIDCVDSASGSSSAGGAMVKAYEFTQTITGPASHATVTPSPLVPGAPMTIGDGGGCGSDTHVGQTVTIMVYNLDGGPGFLFTVLPVDGSGHWGPMTLNSPLGPTVSFGVYVTCGASSSGSADQSRYEYPITTVPVA